MEYYLIFYREVNGQNAKIFAIISHMREGVKDKFVKWFTIVLVAVIFVGGLLFAWPTYLRSRSLQKQDAELARRIEAKRAEIAKLVENQRRFQTDRDFVETIARQNRRVFPGELVFVFDDKKGSGKGK